jgi:hypothetical protein
LDFSQDAIDRACEAVAKKRKNRQPFDKFHVEPEDAVWLTSAGIALDEQATRFKALVTFQIYEANGRNISLTARALRISFNTAKAHIRHYQRLSKDC